MEFRIPKPLQVEHDELHQQLAKLTQQSGRVGEAAKTVAKILHPHFVKEEEYALPPLGILPLLAAGQITPEMADVLSMTQRLKAELPQMLEEHKAIVAALHHLSEVAMQEDQPEYARFAERLMLHAQAEEDVFYPAAMLIGEYVKLKLNR
ncbi:MAG TPA: hemerythrin domain-containing protein [Alphaproteobacteria bacterium]|nr:hemerythrin domain-containing protein [Alphaproteobacteria bacterium]